MSAPELADAIRLTVIEQSKRANIGHIGSALSIADILATLYAGVLRHPGGDENERDRFILSKGHAALALYAVLHATGAMDDETLNSFATDGSALGAHPEHAVPGIDFSTGSLGQGLSIAAGAALAARMQGSERRSFVLVSDAECNEGSLWETAMFAAQRELSNLVAIVDDNGQQALGYTADVLDLSPLAERWRSFGWDTHDVGGHDTAALAETIAGLDLKQGPPHAIVADATFGHGVSFMESRIEWHYWPLDDEQYERSLAELGGGR